MLPQVSFNTSAISYTTLSHKTVPGIGKATATSFTQEGCTRIVLADISEASLTTTQESLTKSYPDTQFLAIPTDISSPEAVRNLFRKAVEKFGRIDYAVNCAGVLGAAKKSHEMTLEEFDHIVNVDYRGSWLCSREELKVMVNQEPLETHDGRKGSRGAIVNVASQLGIVARPQARKFANLTLAVDVYDADMIDSGILFSKSCYHWLDEIRCFGLFGT